MLTAFVVLDQSHWLVVFVELAVCVAVFLMIGFLGLGIAELFVALLAVLILQLSDEESGAVLKILIFYIQVGSALLGESLTPQFFSYVRASLASIHVQAQG